MKQITIVLHCNDDDRAEELFKTLKSMKFEGANHLSMIMKEDTHLVDLKIKGPNDD